MQETSCIKGFLENVPRSSLPDICRCHIESSMDEMSYFFHREMPPAKMTGTTESIGKTETCGAN